MNIFIWIAVLALCTPFGFLLLAVARWAADIPDKIKEWFTNDN